MTSVKWLHRIDAVDAPFRGYQMAGSYRYASSAEDPGAPVSLIRVRALMVPPGIPDFATRMRLVEAGEVELTGRAWAGRHQVARVEVSADGGTTWGEARLGQPVSRFAWRSWTYPWKATPGRYALRVRASDSEGNTQPIEQVWSYQGMGNNMAQRVEVLVR